MNCNKNVDVQYIGDLQIDTLESLPDYILTERDVLDPATGNTIRSIVRTPSAKLFPNANTDNIFNLEANNEGIEIPENQVRAVRVVSEAGANKMYYGDTSHPASMIAVGKAVDGTILCQCSGVINIVNGHSYIIGQQYYLGANGEPTTTSNSYKLFIPVSNTKLVINI